MPFLMNYSEVWTENNKRQFFKRVLNIVCKLTGNGLRHSHRRIHGGWGGPDPQYLAAGSKGSIF